MRLLGAELGLVEPGRVEITLPYRADLCQQNGYLHAGISTTIADTAGGYAACLFEPGQGCADLGVQDELPGAGEGRALHGHRPRGRRAGACPFARSKFMRTRKIRPRSA